MRTSITAAAVALIVILPLSAACSTASEASPPTTRPAETAPALDEDSCKDLIREELLGSEEEVEAVFDRGACKGIDGDRVDELVDSVASELEESPSGDEAVGLDETVTYENGTEISLNRLTRATSGPYAAPESTPYLRFTAKVVNGGEATMDLSTMFVQCTYGDAGESSEEIFDSENGLSGAPATHLRPGRSASAVIGCELPTDEKYMQIEVTPDFETQTAIFAGNVK